MNQIIKIFASIKKVCNQQSTQSEDDNGFDKSSRNNESSIDKNNFEKIIYPSKKCIKLTEKTQFSPNSTISISDYVCDNQNRSFSEHEFLGSDSEYLTSSCTLSTDPISSQDSNDDFYTAFDEEFIPDENREEEYLNISTFSGAKFTFEPILFFHFNQEPMIEFNCLQLHEFIHEKGLLNCWTLTLLACDAFCGPDKKSIFIFYYFKEIRQTIFYLICPKNIFHHIYGKNRLAIEILKNKTNFYILVSDIKTPTILFSNEEDYIKDMLSICKDDIYFQIETFINDITTDHLVSKTKEEQKLMISKIYEGQSDMEGFKYHSTELENERYHIHKYYERRSIHNRKDLFTWIQNQYVQ